MDSENVQIRYLFAADDVIMTSYL